MKQLQPEIKKITEKHKNDPMAARAAQQELFRKHNFNPLGGCSVMFLQLPIFLGLYRALQVDVELREASLLGSSVRWCSNLAAPDMLYNWSAFWDGIGWEGFNTGQGMFYLGPFLNILPLFTVVLFLVQQWVMMPPPTDDQSRMQRNVMNFMMLFMGLIFFKVASGLCIYFIASSLWGLAERKFMLGPMAASTQSPDTAIAAIEATVHKSKKEIKSPGNKGGSGKKGKKGKGRGK